ncbi:hypothetical protein [Vibrio harveyi]|uniref:hypothetical protein n=1 Tax=Vibrio harveyi TaxID=669 RepID=UPI003BB5C670
MYISSFFNLKFRAGAKLAQTQQRLYRFGSLIYDLTVPEGFNETSLSSNLPEVDFEYYLKNSKTKYHNDIIEISRLDWFYHTLIPYPMNYSYYGKLTIKIQLIPFLFKHKKEIDMDCIKRDLEQRYETFYNAEEYDPETGRGYNKFKIKLINEHFNENYIIGDFRLKESFINKRIQEVLIKNPEFVFRDNYIMYEEVRSESNLKNQYFYILNEYGYINLEVHHDGWNDKYMGVCFENSKQAEEIIVSSLHVSKYIEEGSSEHLLK